MENIRTKVKEVAMTNCKREFQLIDSITFLFPKKFFNIEIEPISNPIKEVFLEVISASLINFHNIKN